LGIQLDTVFQNEAKQGSKGFLHLFFVQMEKK